MTIPSLRRPVPMEQITFPFFNLPREVRDQIYAHLISAEFLHSSNYLRSRSRSQQQMYHLPQDIKLDDMIEPKFDTPAMTRLIRNERQREYLKEVCSQELLLYRLIYPLSPLLVNQQFNAELQATLGRTHRLVKANITLGRLVDQPTSAFLHFCAKSRFVYARRVEMKLKDPPNIEGLVLDIPRIIALHPDLVEQAFGLMRHWQFLPWHSRWVHALVSNHTFRRLWPCIEMFYVGSCVSLLVVFGWECVDNYLSGRRTHGSVIILTAEAAFALLFVLWVKTR